MITITIDTGNEAFADGNRGAEVARILRRMADQFEETDHPNRPMDINGNTVGAVRQTGRDRVR